jgi:hypothetical protein
MKYLSNLSLISLTLTHNSVKINAQIIVLLINFLPFLAK